MSRSFLAYIVFLLSGFAALGYEIIWTRLFAIGLGHELPSMLAVVAAFFGGLAIGAWALDGVVSRSRVPGRWYAALEIVIAAWAIVSIWLIPALNRVTPELIGIDPAPLWQWTVSFGMPLITLLPATAAMGATFPAMERLVSRMRTSGSLVGGLYATNTLGAVAGVMLTTFLLAPMLGLIWAPVLLAALNVLCAVLILAGPASGEQVRKSVHHAFDDPPGARRLYVTIFLTGLLGIGYEVLGIRVLSQVLQNTVYTFAIVLSVYLVGTAAGAALYQRLAAKRQFAAGLTMLVQLLALTCVGGSLVLSAGPSMYEWMRDVLGGGVAGSLAAEALLSLAVFLPATLVMGATFSHLAQAARRRDGGLGKALALNTIGSSIAPAVFGVIVLPAVGATWAMIIVGLGYLALLPTQRLSLQRVIPGGVAMCGAVLLLTVDLRLVDVPEGTRLIAYRQGVMASVAVIESQDRQATPEGVPPRVLKVNNRFHMGGTWQSFADRRQGHIPLLLHANPKRALFLGVGSGITAGVAADHPDLEVEAVELLPEIIELLPMFDPVNNYSRLDVERTWHVADARRYIRATDSTYDVIVADLFHPARDGAGMLYTREHFQTARSRLNDGGLFCQWLPLYQMDVQTLRLIVRTFLDVFPNTTGWIAHFNASAPMLGLIGRSDAVRYSNDWYTERVAGDERLRRALEQVAMGNELTLFGCYMADGATLGEFAGMGMLNTDMHPEVMYRAPMFIYTTTDEPSECLHVLLESGRPDAQTLVEPGEAAFAQRLNSYLAARNLYLQAHRFMILERREEAIELLLKSAEASEDFKTAYVMLLNTAADLRTSDRALGIRILQRLRDAQPNDPRAARALRLHYGQ